MVTTTNATFVTVALYLLDLCPQGRSMRNHRRRVMPKIITGRCPVNSLSMNGSVDSCPSATSTTSYVSRLRCSSSLFSNEHLRQFERIEQREVEERAHMRNALTGQGEHLELERVM